MRHVSMKPILATAAFGALLGGCATTVEMGPGYYHYDTGLARPTAPGRVSGAGRRVSRARRRVSRASRRV
jgi:hypothetical protein